ncbi:hypothetical protein C8J57DRAFT_1505240 [Mycena rebaudengoi]|nr:hypothetical protein C8J57DRAFT_1505240 [Mycena rebaudengoi]
MHSGTNLSTRGSADSTATFNFTLSALALVFLDRGFALIRLIIVGVAIYYFFPYGCAATSILILDGGAPITVAYNDLTTVVSTAVDAKVDGFIYTVEERDAVPAAPPVQLDRSCPELHSDSEWPCASDIDCGLDLLFQYVLRRVLLLADSFGFGAPGEQLVLNTLTSTTGGLLSLSINGDDPEVFNTTAPAASCALLSLNATALVKRSLQKRGDAANAQNDCVGY